MEKIIFFDIETVSGVSSYDQLFPAMQHLWDKKSQSWITESLWSSELYSQKAWIYAEFGKIICIVCGYYNQSWDFVTKTFASDDEKLLLSEFFTLLSQYPQYILCGHNAKEFDIPYTCRRGVIHGLQLPAQLSIRDKKPREIAHKDTMEMWKFWDYKAYTSLALLCEILWIETPKDDIDGSQVSTVYRQDHDLDRISQYCVKDVIATAKVYEKLK